MYYEKLANLGVTEKNIDNINFVYDKAGSDNPFGQSDVQKWLNCSKWKATNVMNEMKKAEILYKVKGILVIDEDSFMERESFVL